MAVTNFGTFVPNVWNPKNANGVVHSRAPSHISMIGFGTNLFHSLLRALLPSLGLRVAQGYRLARSWFHMSNLGESVF